METSIPNILTYPSRLRGEGGGRTDFGGSPSSTSSLVVSGHKSPFVSTWSRAQRRLYHRTLSGFELAKVRGEHVRVITLTSSLESGDFHRSFEKLKKRIRREYGRFEYIGVRELTPERGLVHLHLAYRGSYIPQTWLSDNWKEIHGAKIVWIAQLYSWKFAKHLARYLIKDGVGRFLCSWGWVYRGFIRDWGSVVSRYGRRALDMWRRFLHGSAVRWGWLNEEHLPPWINQQKFKV